MFIVGGGTRVSNLLRIHVDSITSFDSIELEAMLRYGGFVCLILINSILVRAECPPEREQDLHDEAKLHSDLLCAYNSNYRPVKNHKSAVNVKVRFALKYISFDALEETITLHSWVALNWKDEYLNWTPSDYGNIQEVQIESHEIWSPSMALFNADATTYQSDSFYTTCLVNSEGTVTCVPHIAHTGICRTTLRSWPYDVQNCTLYFGSWMHTGEQVNFTFYNTKPVVLDDFQNGPGWKLLNVAHDRLPGAYNCCPNSTYPMLKYTFTLRREAAGPAAIIVVPSIVVVLLTLTSLLMDIKDNTRLMLICFSLFGHFIFITEIGYIVPKLSSDTPIILLFIRDSMVVTLAGILVTLMLMSLRKRTLPPPAWIVSLNRLASSGPGRYVIFTEFDPNVSVEGKVLTEDSVSGSNNDKSNSAVDWIQFASLLNTFVFIVSFIVYFILITTYIPTDS
ncbi:neuronal acetylcholine receptor subunit beta-3-like [Nymphalis io]|uniref:neuronal acetylcholine receptor subunit beta-3-like n=1 Tax=Inachis io TaxID=171585 RepID=UPI00216766F8|nr:neuronal acetylcholine receptor subunit beta-3-like [Nymphalis io]